MKRADELSFELTRAVLVQVSPAEVPIVDALGVEFVEAASAPHGGDGALGFDVDQITYAVAASSSAVLIKDYLVELGKSMAKELGKSIAGEQGAGMVEGLVKSLKRKRGAEHESAVPASIELDSAEISEVRRRAFQHAQGMGLDDLEAALIADAIAGSLVSED